MYSTVIQPEKYTTKLFPHQLTSIYDMEELEHNKFIKLNNYKIDTRIGIQADITGYGKTCSMIGLIVRNKMKWVENEEFNFSCAYTSDNNGNIKIYKEFSYPKIKTTLIVVGQSLVNQWKEELCKTKLNYIIIKTKKKAKIVTCSEFDVVLCTPTMYNTLLERNNTCAWKRFVYDEPGTICIPSMKNIITGFTWFVTATPDLLKYKYQHRRNHYIANLNLYTMDYIFFKSLIIKNDDNYVTQSWKMPEINYYYYNCYNPISHTLNGFISEKIQKMLDAGNIRGAIEHLGGKETKNIVDVVKRRFEEDLRDVEHKIDRYTRRNNIILKNEWIEKKLRIENNIKELNNRFENSLNEGCNICLENLKAPTLVPCCQNISCGKCIIKWVNTKKTCPFCRSKLLFQDLIYIDNKDKKNNIKKITKKLTKVEKIIELITFNKKSKFIIFSDEDYTFSILDKNFKENSIICKEIKGRTETRYKNIENFKNGKCNVIFLNSKNNGAGINLQECTDLILYHNMETSIKKQIIGRAIRVGRTKELNIHNLR